MRRNLTGSLIRFEKLIYDISNPVLSRVFKSPGLGGGGGVIDPRNTMRTYQMPYCTVADVDIL